MPKKTLDKDRESLERKINRAVDKAVTSQHPLKSKSKKKK